MYLNLEFFIRDDVASQIRVLQEERQALNKIMEGKSSEITGEHITSVWCYKLLTYQVKNTENFLASVIII